MDEDVRPDKNSEREEFRFALGWLVRGAFVGGLIGFIPLYLIEMTVGITGAGAERYPESAGIVRASLLGGGALLGGWLGLLWSGRGRKRPPDSED